MRYLYNPLSKLWSLSLRASPHRTPKERFLYNPLRKLWSLFLRESRPREHRRCDICTTHCVSCGTRKRPLCAASLGERAAAQRVSMGSLQVIGMKREPKMLTHRLYLARKKRYSVVLRLTPDILNGLIHHTGRNSARIIAVAPSLKHSCASVVSEPSA